MAAEVFSWLGYQFYVNPMDSSWVDKGGIYLFCGKNANGQWVALYVGQAKSLKDRLNGHERWDEAVRLGASRVHARVVETQSERDQLEAALIAALRPKLNTQGK